MAFPAADATEPLARPSEDQPSRWARFCAAMEAYPLERIGMAAIAAGVVLRLLVPFMMDFRSDGDTYVAMGHAWMKTQTFLMPYGDVTTWGPTDAQYSNHYPPAYPFFLGVVFKLFGYGLMQAKLAAVFVSLAALAAVYWTSRDLYGNVPAALVTGLLAVEPHLLWVTGAGFSENMVLLFFALTMWAIVKSLTDDRFIVLAGLFAALAYLSRASVGYFFVVAGMGGLLWRLYHRGWAVLANVWYLLAIALFGGVVAAWATRNIMLFGSTAESITGGEALQWGALGLAAAGLALTLPFLANPRLRRAANLAPGLALLGIGALGGTALVALTHLPMPGGLAGLASATFEVKVPLWETSSYTRWVSEHAADNPHLWQKALVAKIPFFLLMAAWYVLPFLPESWRATKRIREESTSALWLSVFLVFVIAWAISSMFWVYEQSPMYWYDNHRYVVIGLLPLGWLLVREADFTRTGPRLRYALLLLSLFAACGAIILSPVKFSDLRAAEAMDPYLREGDEIGIDGGTIKYAFYAYLSEPDKVRVYGCSKPEPPEPATCLPGYSPEFILTLKAWEDYGPEYVRVGEFRQTFWTGGVMTAALLARTDVVADRGVPTNMFHDGT